MMSRQPAAYEHQLVVAEAVPADLVGVVGRGEELLAADRHEPLERRARHELAGLDRAPEDRAQHALRAGEGALHRLGCEHGGWRVVPLERDRHLAPVRRLPGIEIDHGRYSSSAITMGSAPTSPVKPGAESANCTGGVAERFSSSWVTSARA